MISAAVTVLLSVELVATEQFKENKLLIHARQPCNKKAVPTLVWVNLCRNSNTHPHIIVYTGETQHLSRCVPCDATHNFVRVMSAVSKKSLCLLLAFIKSVIDFIHSESNIHVDTLV